MFGANNFCKQLVRLLLAPFSFISLLLLSACGGGGSSTSIPQDTGISVTSVQSDSYKELTPAQSAGASFPSDTLVELPGDANLGVGNVVVVNDRIVKLSSIETGAASGKIRYGFTSAQLDDIFKSLTLDGSVSAESAAVAPVARTLAVKGKTTCGLSASVMNLPGVACNFNLSSNPGPLSLDGNASFGGRLDFKAWDVIRNTGSGNIELSFDGDIAVRLKKESSGLLPENDVCSSTRDEVVGARARLFTLSLPTNVPTVSVRIPFCLAMDAKAGITGKLFQFKQQGLLKIAVGEKSMPRITSTLPSSSATTKAEDAESWTIDSQTTTISLIPVDVSANAALSAEIAVEVAASLASHPKATMTATGLVASFIGTGNVTGKFAAVENIGKTIAAMGIDPLYCLKIGVGVDFQSTIYVSLPAFKIFFGPDYTFSRNLFASPVPIWSSSAPIGKCDFKVNTQTIITSVSKPGGQVDFSVKVVKNDPSAGRLWDDRQPSGTLAIKSSTGKVLCTVTLSAGKGACSYSYPAGGVDMAEVVTGKYAGDEYFRISEVSTTVQVIAASVGFTKISSDGQDLPLDAPIWSCVRHNATGLLWEANLTRQAPRPCGYRICTGYTNFGDGRAYDASTVPTTVGSLCGKTGWRLPTKAEGLALVNALLQSSKYEFETWFGKSDTVTDGWTWTPELDIVDSVWMRGYICFVCGGVGIIDYAVPSFDSYISVRLVR